MKVYWDIYNGRKNGVGDYVCSVESEDVATDICKVHPRFFKVQRIIEDKKKDEN